MNNGHILSNLMFSLHFKITILTELTFVAPCAEIKVPRPSKCGLAL